MDFAKDNFLRLNAKKTNLLQIHTAQSKNLEHSTIKVNDEEVTMTTVGKLLGVKITNTFNWKAHCDEIVSKLRSEAYRFSMLRANLSKDSLLKVYDAHVKSHILYTIVIWGGSPHLSQVFIAQKRCLRAMVGKRYWRGPDPLETCKTIFEENKILTVYSLYILESAKFVKKHPEKFPKNSDHPDARIHVTRNTPYNESDLFVQPCRNTNFSQNPMAMLPRIWNHLPVYIKEIANFDKFKDELELLLLKYVFYDLHEYFTCKFD